MDGRGNYQPYWGHVGNGHPFLHLLILVLIVFLVAVALVYLYRLAISRRAGTARLVPAAGAVSADALGVVRARYARGEIDRDEFLRMSADLGAPVAAAPPPASEDTPAADGESNPGDSTA